MEKHLPKLSVSDFVAIANQTLEYAYPSIEIEGEVASFKVNQNKYVFFDLKDEGASIGCFMMVWQLRLAIEDGMKVVVTAQPRLTKWGKFSLTVRSIRASGEGSLRKSFELLKSKLEKEGMFAADRKRLIPRPPEHVAIISSIQAAGYKDFIKIINDRWGGLNIDVAHVQVQGEGAADQIIRAIEFFNQRENLPDVIAIIRGGGSADDLATFNDELLVRSVAGSRVPVLTGIGHDVDVSLVDLAADESASTPSNAAERLVPDKTETIRLIRHQLASVPRRMDHAIDLQLTELDSMLGVGLSQIDRRYRQLQAELAAQHRTLSSYDPKSVLERGYAIVRGELDVGEVIDIETSKLNAVAEVRSVSKK